MKFIIAILFLCLALTAPEAKAGQAEVRDVALSYNCPPKKIEIFKQPVGAIGAITYRVQCTLAKTVDTADKDAAKPPDALLIACDQNLCQMLRPVSIGEKK